MFQTFMTGRHGHVSFQQESNVMYSCIISWTLGFSKTANSAKTARVHKLLVSVMQVRE